MSSTISARGGSQAIKENHEKHMKSGGVILYASMCDPILQIAGCESEIPPDDLASIAKQAFDLALEREVRITRVISRPYIFKDGEFTRTANRRDFVLQLPEGVETFIDVARDNGVYTVSIGKCADVVNTKWDVNRNLSGPLPSDLEFMATGKSKNQYSVREAIDVLKSVDRRTFILCNLPDTDSLYGHNRDIKGCLESLEAFDHAIPLIQKAMPAKGYLLITADHGMRDGGDYGYHSREAVPVIGMGNGSLIKNSMDIPTSESTYAVLSHICAKIFGFEEEYVERCRLSASFE